MCKRILQVLGRQTHLSCHTTHFKCQQSPVVMGLLPPGSVWRADHGTVQPQLRGAAPKHGQSRWRKDSSTSRISIPGSHSHACTLTAACTSLCEPGGQWLVEKCRIPSYHTSTLSPCCCGDERAGIHSRERSSGSCCLASPPTSDRRGPTAAEDSQCAIILAGKSRAQALVRCWSHDVPLIHKMSKRS